MDGSMAVSGNITLVITVNTVATTVVAMLLIDELTVVIIAAAIKDNDVTYILKIETKLLPVFLLCHQLLLHAAAGLLLFSICVLAVIGFWCVCVCPQVVQKLNQIF